MKYLICAIVLVVLVALWLWRDADLVGTWVVPELLSGEFGLQTFVLQLDSCGKGFLVLVDSAGAVLYCDSIKWSQKCSQITIKTQNC